jgi:hypothetical protein
MKRLAASTFTLALLAALFVGVPAVAGGPTDPVGGEKNLGQRGGLKYRSETLKVGSSGHFSGATEAAWMACGSHSSPWSPSAGGGKVSGNNKGNLLSAMRPRDLDAPFETPDDTDPDDWWDTTVRSVLDRSLTGYTICSKKQLRYVRTDTPDGASSGRTGSTDCPGQLKLVGGGAFIATTDSYINSSYPGPGNTWRARVFDTVGGAGGMETYAVCRHRTGVKIENASHAGISHGSAGTAIARCADNRHVIGGGGRLTGPIAKAHLAASFPIDGPDFDVTPDDGWKVVGYNDAGKPKKVTAYAICVTTG